MVKGPSFIAWLLLHAREIMAAEKNDAYGLVLILMFLRFLGLIIWLVR